MESWAGIELLRGSGIGGHAKRYFGSERGSFGY